jgi:hypothetical protein
MKKLVHLAWLLLLLLTACQKHEDEVAPGDLPDARLNKVLSDYKAQLTSTPYGWKGVLKTSRGERYNFLFTFSPEGRVTTASDINVTTTALLESSYRLKAMQRPTLLFDTYSYLHILADPDPAANGGVEGQGKFADFEFYFESATAETITLTGQHQGSELVLTKATQAEAANHINNIVAQATALAALNTFTTYFKRLTIGSKAYDIQVNSANRTMVFTYFTGETANTFMTGFSYTNEGVLLNEPFSHEGLTITLLKGLQFNSGSRQLDLTIDNVAATVQEAARPVKVDVQGARNFLSTAIGDDYWVGETGFTVNGVLDALNFSQIPNFAFLALWPKFGTSGTTRYDLLAFVKINAAGTGLEVAYGPAATSRVTADGRMVYTLLGLLGTVPPAEMPAVTAAQQIWTEPQGFFVVTYGANIDLVSAKDGKTWLSTIKP